ALLRSTANRESSCDIHPPLWAPSRVTVEACAGGRKPSDLGSGPIASNPLLIYAVGKAVDNCLESNAREQETLTARALRDAAGHRDRVVNTLKVRGAQARVGSRPTPGTQRISRFLWDRLWGEE